MPLDPLNNPLLRSPRSFAPTIPAMTEAAAAATPEQLADIANDIGRALDPDVGGDRSFAGVLCAESPPPATHVVLYDRSARPDA